MVVADKGTDLAHHRFPILHWEASSVFRATFLGLFSQTRRRQILQNVPAKGEDLIDSTQRLTLVHLRGRVFTASLETASPASADTKGRAEDVENPYLAMSCHRPYAI